MYMEHLVSWKFTKKKKRILKKYIWVVLLRVKEVQTETEAQA